MRAKARARVLACGLASLAPLALLGALACGQVLGVDELEKVTCEGDCATVDAGPRPTTPAPSDAARAETSVVPDATPRVDASPADAASERIAPTVSHLFPNNVAYPRATTWTIASEGPSRIFYTLDGGLPTTSSESAPSPLSLPGLGSGTIVRWLADNGATEAPRSRTITLGTSTGDYDFIVDQTKIESAGPVYTVAPNASVQLSVALQIWTHPTCPTCILQIVYGVDRTPQGCLVSTIPGIYPGQSGTSTVTLKAPAAAGAYKIRVGMAMQFECPSAIAANPLGGSEREIGLLIVK